MAVIDQIREHFDRQGVRTVEVPEWGNEQGPLVIHTHPLNMAEKQKIAQAGERDGRLMSLVHALILKARDSKGEPIFTVADKKMLAERADPEVIARVVTELMYTPSPEDMEKN